jgi:hypothetical protein
MIFLDNDCWLNSFTARSSSRHLTGWFIFIDLLEARDQLLRMLALALVVGGVVGDYHTRGILVFACPHMDTIKLWLLPVVQPWFEDTSETRWPRMHFGYRVE